LGSGGASKAVSYILQQKSIPFQIVSRNKTKQNITYNEITAELTRHTTFIINTTPLGMFPNIDEMPQIPYAALNENNVLIDLIYNPEETLFLKEGRKRGAITINGLPMLKAQADASWELFICASE
jgi:shikimate dehydrogenase